MMQIKRLLLCLTVLLVLSVSSCNVFERKDSVVKEELELFYNEAQKQYESGEYVKCVISLLEAEDLALRLNDYYYLGLIYNSLRIVYSDSYNVDYALKCAKSSYDSFLKSDSSRLTEYALLDLGVAYINAGEYKKGCSILENIAKEKHHYEDLADDNIFEQLYSEALVIM